METENEKTPDISVGTEERQVLPEDSKAAANTLQFFFNPPGTLRLTVGEHHSYITVKLFQSAPLSKPGRFLSAQSGRNEEIVLIDRIEDLSPDSQTTAREEIHRRYLTATVKAITSVKTEFGVTYWHVVTDRGERDFVVQSLSESCVWLSDTHILLIDVDGNRFEIPDRYKLDTDSRTQLESVL